jgi:hypothetical protein
MSTILPNVEGFRNIFLPAILAELDAKFTVASRDGKGFHAAWLNAAGDLPVNVGGRTISLRDVIAGKNGFASSKDIDWRATSVEGIASDTLEFIIREVERERPEWFVKVQKVYVKRAPSLDVLAELGL